jgi:polyhydroxyalkanoate synthesis repressor PhaR
MPVIKRYPNRKLYDTEAKRYVTLDEITYMIQEGANVQVIDHESGDDLTTLTLTQIILEQEKKSAGFLPRNLLTNLIRTGGDTVEQMLRSIQVGLNRTDAPSDTREAASESPDEHSDESEVTRAPASAMESGGETEEGKSSVERARQIADERLTEMLHLINVPSRKEVEALQVQLAVLSQRLEEMLEAQDAEEEGDGPGGNPARSD